MFFISIIEIKNIIKNIYIYGIFHQFDFSTAHGTSIDDILIKMYYYFMSF